LGIILIMKSPCGSTPKGCRFVLEFDALPGAIVLLDDPVESGGTVKNRTMISPAPWRISATSASTPDRLALITR
jgi:hypothetical protein